MLTSVSGAFLHLSHPAHLGISCSHSLNAHDFLSFHIDQLHYPTSIFLELQTIGAGAALASICSYLGLRMTRDGCADMALLGTDV